MALGKGIPVINGFDLNSKLPLDSRAVADTLADMNALITSGSVADGQLCYCKEDKKLYVLKEGTWSEVGGGGADVLDVSQETSSKIYQAISGGQHTTIENVLTSDELAFCKAHINTPFLCYSSRK